MNIEDKELAAFQKAQRRKDIIKNITIVFLMILLALTFFSRTIMNLTLPEVATHVAAQGEVSPRIRGQGTAEVDDPYTVSVTQARTIRGVAVHVGQDVKRGDVIYYLEDTESEELRTARQELEDQKASFTRKLFDGTLSDSDITRMRVGSYRSDDEIQAALAYVNRRFEAATREKASAEAAYEKLVAEEEKKSSGSAEASGTGAVDAKAADDDYYDDDDDDDDDDSSDSASTASTKESKKEKEYRKKLAKANLRKIEAEAALAEITTEREKVISTISAELELKSTQEAINKAQAKVDRLQKDEIGATINSPVDGKVTTLSYGAGETTSPDSPVAIIRIVGKKLTVSFSVTKAQAQKLKVGEEAQPQNSWEYDDSFHAVLRQITADSSDPQNSRLLKFEIESTTVSAGDSVQLQIAESTKTYDLVVPNSAVRSDSNGSFVLVLKTKQSPLGNRYIVSREDVKVLAKDDTNSAISGAIGMYSYVVTTSSKMISSGDQVRLADEVEKED